jgi:hypothetical protein
MPKVFVVPKPGMMIPDPAMKGGSPQVRLPEEGKFVEDGPYWRNLDRHGDLTFLGADKPSAVVKSADKGGSQ